MSVSLAWLFAATACRHADAGTVRAAAQHQVAGFIVESGTRATVLAKLQAVLPPPAVPEPTP